MDIKYEIVSEGKRYDTINISTINKISWSLEKTIPVRSEVYFQNHKKTIVELYNITKLLVLSTPPGLNSLTAVALEDLIKPFYKGQLSDEKATKISK